MPSNGRERTETAILRRVLDTAKSMSPEARHGLFSSWDFGRRQAPHARVGSQGPRRKPDATREKRDRGLWSHRQLSVHSQIASANVSANQGPEIMRINLQHRVENRRALIKEGVFPPDY